MVSPTARPPAQSYWQRGGGSSHRLSTTNGDNAPASAASDGQKFRLTPAGKFKQIK